MTSLAINKMTLQINTKTICHDLSLCFNRGEIWGILAPNGAGKTTFLHALAGLYTLTHGEVKLNDHNIKTIPRKSIAQLLAMLFQDLTHSLPQTVWEYCVTARYPHQTYFQQLTRDDEQIVQDSLAKMALSSLHHQFITRLSGGEKQRLAIAAVLAQTPAIFLLDEPTNHLDVAHQSYVLHHFQQLAQRKLATIIMSLHDINLVQQFCQHVLLLFPDGDSKHGPVEQVLTRENLTRLYQHPVKKISDSETSLWCLEAVYNCHNP